MRLSKKLVIAALGSATLVLNSVAAFAAGPTIEDTEGTRPGLLRRLGAQLWWAP